MSEGPNVRAKVETLEPGDRIYLSAPGKNPAGYPVERVERYDALGLERVECYVVIYRGSIYGWDRGISYVSVGELSLPPMRAGERVPARRAAA